MYTVKKAHPRPVTMYSEINKRKRREYVEKIMNRIGIGKQLSTLIKLMWTYSCVDHKGVHVRECAPWWNILHQGGKTFTFLEESHSMALSIGNGGEAATRNKIATNAWDERSTQSLSLSRTLLWSAIMPLFMLALRALLEKNFLGVELLRLSPYSAPLNPIEECWSSMKAVMKRDLAANSATMMNTTPQGMTQTEYRMQYLERCIDNAILSITSILCLKTFNHVQKHFARVIQLQD